MPNVVEILVVAKNATKEGFAAAEAESQSFNSKMQKVGLIGAAALIGIGVASVDMAAKFDSSMTLLQTQAGVSHSKLQVLQAGVLALAGQVGFSPDSLAESAYHVASNMESMGATSTQMLNAVKVAAEGAATGHADLVDVTNALGAAIASGIPGVQNYQKAMGVLNATVGTGDMKMQDLADAFGTGLLASVKGFGLSITDVGAALATFGDNNIRGAKAGTDLRMAVQALAAPTKKGADLLTGMGMTVSQLADDMRTKGLLFALEDLKKHMTDAGVSASESGQIITEMFGKKAGVGVQVLYNQLDRLQSKYPALAKGAGDFGSAWATTQQTLTQKVNDVKASFEALIITLGNKLMPIAQAVFGWMATHSADVAKITEAILALVAGLAAYAIVAKTVAIAQGILNAVMDMNPFVAVAAGVVALSILIIKYHTQIWNFIVKIWHDIANFFTVVWGQILSFAKQWWPLLLGPSGLIIKYHQDIWTFIQKIWHDITNFLSSTWNSIVSTGKTVWTAIENFFKNLWTTEEQGWRKLGSDVLNILTTAWNAVSTATKTVWNDIVSFFTSVPGRIVKAVGDAGNVLFNWGKGVLQGLIDGFHSIWSAVANFFTSLPGKILGWLGIHSPPDWAIDAGVHIATGIGIGMGRAQERVKTATAALAAIASKTVGGPGGVPQTGDAQEAQKVAMKMAALIGWTGNEWTALNNVAMRESGWNMYATNPGSKAYGIAQFDVPPGGNLAANMAQYAVYGGNANTLGGQLTGFFNYIKQRYGDPAGAWQHELNYGWYDQGGWLKPGYTLAYNGTGQPERVGGTGTIHIEISGGQSSFDQFMLQWLRENARIKGGGNVQKAFGRT